MAVPATVVARAADGGSGSRRGAASAASGGVACGKREGDATKAALEAEAHRPASHKKRRHGEERSATTWHHAHTGATEATVHGLVGDDAEAEAEAEAAEKRNPDRRTAPALSDMDASPPKDAHVQTFASLLSMNYIFY
ncbi:MAG: hypothetical protein EOO41_01245 [Methanobacteriota archaeon]|nr:MAG: hypothetical protein EOO41_01245 [Euryarchaeota archaeon]